MYLPWSRPDPWVADVSPCGRQGCTSASLSRQVIVDGTGSCLRTDREGRSDPVSLISAATPDFLALGYDVGARLSSGRVQRLPPGSARWEDACPVRRLQG